MSVPSGLIYRAMGACDMLTVTTVLTPRHIGFPLDFFPVLFAVPRVVGWLAHWRQVRLERRERRALVINSLPQMMMQEGGVKIWRPRQVRVFESGFSPVPLLIYTPRWYQGLCWAQETGLRAN